MTVGDTLDVLTGGAVAACSGIAHACFSSYLESGGNAYVYYRQGSYSVTQVNEQLGSESSISSIRLLGNFPNPFNAQTTILYTTPHRIPVRLSIVDLLGREVRVLKDEVSEVGTRRATLNAEGFSTGVYYVVLLTGATKDVTPIVLMR